MPINLNKAAAQPTPKAERPFIPSPQQQAFFDWIEHDTGNAILEAVAGSGKTTTILKAVPIMRGRVWFGVYNKKMSDEVKGKIADSEVLSALRNFYAQTFHSAGLGALRFAYGKSHKLNVDGNKLKGIIRTMKAELNAKTQEIGAPSESIDWLRDFVLHSPAIVGVVSMAKNRGIGPVTPDTDEAWIEMIKTYALGESLPEKYSVEKFLGYCREVLRRNNADLNTIDYDDMVYLPLAKKLRPLTYDWVLVDEAQDTNPTRRALAKKMLKPGGRFVAVGDARQAIFGFTGADNDSLEVLGNEFNCKRLGLTVTYRCPKAVVQQARMIVSHIEAHESAPDGQYRFIPQADFFDEVEEWTPAKYGEIAILCRVNQPLMEICFDLIRRRIPAKIEGRDIGAGLILLIRSWGVSRIDALQDRLQRYMEKELEKARKIEDEAREEKINDQVGTINVLIQMTVEEGGNSVDDVCRIIENLFQDNVAGRGRVTLCSAHKSKGLEWNKVYLWGRNRYMPSRWARQDWELEQEANLEYVAVTRAMEELIDVNVREPEKENEEWNT